MLLELLKNYNKQKQVDALLGQKSTYNMRIEKMLKVLEKYEMEIILMVVMNNTSIRSYAAYTGFSRTFISKEIMRIIALMEQFWKLLEGQDETASSSAFGSVGEERTTNNN